MNGQKKDIFNQTDITDLPPEINELLHPSNCLIRVLSKQILELFEIQSVLTTNEIIIGLWRSFKNTPKDKIQLQNMLNRWCKRGTISKLDIHHYKIMK